MTSAEERVALVRSAYQAFNRRDIDAVLALLDPEVEWPNVAEASVLHGHQAIRDYWEDQFRRGDPHVEPTSFRWQGETLVVTVHQIIRDRQGNQIRDGYVIHTYTFRGEQIVHMEVGANPNRP